MINDLYRLIYDIILVSKTWNDNNLGVLSKYDQNNISIQTNLIRIPVTIWILSYKKYRNIDLTSHPQGVFLQLFSVYRISRTIYVMPRITRYKNCSIDILRLSQINILDVSKYP